MMGTGCIYSLLALITTATCIAHTVLFSLAYKYYNDINNDDTKSQEEKNNAFDHYIINGSLRDHVSRIGASMAASILYLLSLILSCCMSCCGKDGGEHLEHHPNA